MMSMHDHSTVQPADTIGSTLKQCKKLTNSTNDQYIELRTPGASGLPYSAKFRCGDVFWKLHGEECLVTIGFDYVAQASIEYIPELDEVSDFDTSKELLLAHLKIDNVLFDRLVVAMENTVGTIKLLICELGADTNNNRWLLELCRIAHRNCYNINVDFSIAINSNKFIKHSQLKAAIEKHVKQNQNLKELSFLIRQKCELIKDNFFAQSLQTAIRTRKTLILEMCTPQLKQSILHLEPQNCLLLSKNDVKLFSDLESTWSEELFKEVLPKIQTNFINQVASMGLIIDYYKTLPLVNSIYFYVCKSMSETAKRVEEEFGIRKSLMYENEWQVTGIEDSKVSSVSAKCFAKQLQMLVDMANYYEPGKILVRKKYPYKYQIDYFNASPRSREDLLVWFCLVDATMVDIFQGNTKRIMAFSAVLEMFYNHVSHSRSSSQESIRMAAHNALEFVVLVEQSGLGTIAQNSEVLRELLSFIGPNFLSDKLAPSCYRDFLELYKNHWILSNEVELTLTSKLEGKHLNLDLCEITFWFSNIVSFHHDVHPEDGIEFFRAYNDLLMVLEDMPLDWYVRIPDRGERNKLLWNRIIKRVPNKHIYTNNECYQVQRENYDRITEFCTNNEPPEHYQIEVLKTLLNIIANCAMLKTWFTDKKLSPKEQLIATVLLMNAVRSSLLYLKEQTDYIDFKKYYEESVKPFSSVIDDSISLQDFCTRVELIKDSFLNSRNQSSIKPHNECFDANLLKSSFDRYNEQFMKYMVVYSKLSRTYKIRKIADDVRSKIPPICGTEWTTEFKQTFLPRVLAGLAAVWFIQMSRDEANSGKLLEPHSIPILSILRLLHFDEKVTGDKEHLAQMLNGQDKSVVLGLVAALMALFDHDVVVMCNSNYFANGDFSDFKDLFKSFSVSKKIFYQTFDIVARKEMRKLYARETKYICNCIAIPRNEPYFNNFDPELKNAVLLFDEVTHEELE